MGAQQPANLLLLHGRGNGTDSGGRPVKAPPAFRRIAPKPPTWLTREAKAEWQRVVPGLQRLDLLKEEDRALLAAYCETWARFVEATRVVQREGLTVENCSIRKDGTESTWVTANPAVAVARNAGRELRAFGNLFGLSPASEMALGRVADGGEDDNPFAGGSSD